MDFRGLRSTGRLALLASLACTACVLFTGERDKAPIEQLVELKPDIASRDLFYGMGGKKNAPDPDAAYQFLERDESGASTNFEVKDPSGRVWDAKFGPDAKPEVAASRLLWAIGFRQPPVYYVGKWRIASGEETGEQPEARFRLEQPHWKKHGTWAWQENPFVGTRELRGLVVMVAMINYWDVKTSNNRIYEVKGGRPERLYVVKDLGDSFGGTVKMFLGRSANLDEFLREKFIREVKKDGRVDLYYHPVILNRSIEDDLTVADVLWTCRRLAKLSDRQWQDAFRAAGYDEKETTAYVGHMKRKVREGLALGDGARS